MVTFKGEETGAAIAGKVKRSLAWRKSPDFDEWGRYDERKEETDAGGWLPTPFELRQLEMLQEAHPWDMSRWRFAPCTDEERAFGDEPD